MKTRRGLALLLGLGLTAVAAEAAAPPAGSPAARGLHPRLFFTAAQLPALRDRIATHYRTEFQNFINLLNNTAALSSGQAAIESDWGSLNYAFVAVLDPAEMRSRGFTFASALDTPQEYCARAIAYARTKLGAISVNEGQGHSDLTTGYPKAIYVPVLAAYDWCYPHLSAADRTAIVDAFVNAYLRRYRGQNLLTLEASGLDMLANNQASADIHDILGIVAFYGDPYPAAALQAEMYDAFHTIWMDRVLVELNYFYRHGTGWHEGPGGYLEEGFLNLGLPIAMFSSALGTDYISSTPFFARYPVFVEANVKPHSLLTACGSTGTARCPEYLERWGTISGGISGVGCKAALLASGMLRHVGHPDAPLAKWVVERTAGGCTAPFVQYGGTWAHATLYWFIFGNKEVTAQSPAQRNLAKTQRLGMGEYVMRSGYSSTDSQIVFWANPHGMYGHASQEYGHFSLHKFGNLILTAANSKSGDAVLSSAKFNTFGNLIGIHKGASDPTLGFNGGRPDPIFGPRGINRVRLVGRLVAETINNPNFDYVAYDNSAAWHPDTVELSQRELVYLRGPLNREYLVVLDRVSVRNPSVDEKIWKIWVPAAPVFVDGTPTSPRAGKWTSTDTTIVSVTNRFSGLRSPNFESAPTHGRFFMKILAPDGFRVNVLGGPGLEFQSGDDDGTTPWGAPSMTQAMHEYLGWGRIEVRPTTARNFDLFLNVIQFGDATTLSSMSPVARIDSLDGKMVGADIGDAGGNRVVLFSAAPNGAPVAGDVTYLFRPVAAGSRHLLVNMGRSVTYHVRAVSTGSGTTVVVSTAPQSGSLVLVSNDQGVLAFTLEGLTVVNDATPPAAPRNLRVQ